MKKSEIAHEKKYSAMVATTLCNAIIHAIVIALKDPEVMGKNVYSYNRAQRFLKYVIENYNQMMPAFNYTSPERDYSRDFITRKFKEIYPNDGIETFEDLFPFAHEIRAFLPGKIDTGKFYDGDK